LLCAQRKIPDDGQRNSPKYVEFYSKNKFEILVHLVGLLYGYITMHGHLNGNACSSLKKNNVNTRHAFILARDLHCNTSTTHILIEKHNTLDISKNAND